jgi:N-acetylgalactosamine-N,N'-diacetylbacillosaminyl-diphospho-undecaprenol 4-alpha-N-acetylgalactosaminyltransferase
MSKKICILTDSLSSGGAEKVAANMSISLNKKGYHVIVFSMKNEIDYHFEGQLYNFGLIKEKHTRLKAFLKFKRYFKLNKFDFIIDHRTRTKFFKELLFSKGVFRKCKVIYCVHNFRLAYYFSYLNTPWLSVLPHTKNRIFVSVCEEIRKHLKRKLNIESKTIYNFINANDFSTSLDDNEFSKQNYIIGVGRLTTIKQFDKLIKSYFKSELSKNNIKLFILGDGSEKENLKSLISQLNLQKHVELIPFKNNPFPMIRNAKALVLSSKVEGFPMVLLEALSLNTPIIAFNCKSGPSEIITNEVNGLLVENQNEEQLIIALNKLMDISFYQKLKTNTQIDLDKFSEETIIQNWVNLLENQR